MDEKLLERLCEIDSARQALAEHLLAIGSARYALGHALRDRLDKLWEIGSGR